MLKDIVEVRPLEGYRIYIRFEDGICGEVDLEETIRLGGVFAPLKDRARFVEAYVQPELGTVCWPNGADLDPDVLYARVTGSSMPTLEVGTQRFPTPPRNEQ